MWTLVKGRPLWTLSMQWDLIYFNLWCQSSIWTKFMCRIMTNCQLTLYKTYTYRTLKITQKHHLFTCNSPFGELHSSILSYNPSRLNRIINSGKHNVPSPPNMLVIISKLSFWADIISSSTEISFICWKNYIKRLRDSDKQKQDGFILAGNSTRDIDDYK